jgi:DNA-binding transcriptional ArsR family regulator
MVNYQEKITAVFSALADPIRRDILWQLSKTGDEPVTELAKPFRVSLPAISRHLRVLEQAQLIERKREGRVHMIRLRPASLKHAQEWITQCAAGWDHSFDNLERLLEMEQKQSHQKRSNR